MTIEAPLRPRVMVATLVVVGAIVWVVPMTRSLWLDETLTRWVTQGSMAETIHRSITYQQWPLYYVLVWPFAHLGGSHEWILRLPSLAASVLTAWLLWRLARGLLGEGAGGVAVLAWMGTWATIEAYDARPYALGLAFTVGSTLALVEVLEHPSVRSACIYGLVAAGVLWAHYLFGPVLVAHAVVLVTAVREGGARRIGWWPLAAGAAVFIVAILPVLGQVLSLWSRRVSLSTGGASAVLVPALIANLLVIPAAVVVALRYRGSISFERVRLAPHGAVLLIAWAVLPPVVLVLASELSGPYFLNGRYLVSATPAVALLVAWGTSALRPQASQRVFVVALAVATAIAFPIWYHRSDDWRGAVEAARTVTDADTLVLARVRLVEAKQVDWLTDPERRSYVLAPFAVYPLPSEPVPLPLFPHDTGADAYLTGILDGPIAETDRFVLIEQGSVYRPWLDERLGPLGWTSRVIGPTTEPDVIEFTRST